MIKTFVLGMSFSIPTATVNLAVEISTKGVLQKTPMDRVLSFIQDCAVARTVPVYEALSPFPACNPLRISDVEALQEAD